MIIDDQTNFLYLADTLEKKFPKFYHEFTTALKECNVEYDILPCTKDIWAVDYMPIQRELNDFVRFVYRPSYLTKEKKYLATISDSKSICNEINIKHEDSAILIDGGNVVHWKDKVIMTTRIFSENPTYEKKTLEDLLKQELRVEKIIFIPEQPGDFTGHSDGMVRFIDDKTVFVNDNIKEKKGFRDAFLKALSDAGLSTVELPYEVYDNKSVDDASGIYINYLQMENLIVVPVYNTKTRNQQAVDIIASQFPVHKIIPIECSDIAKEGGVLNCITWNIKR